LGRLGGPEVPEQNTAVFQTGTEPRGMGSRGE
jgi:hypothetical protein